MGYIALYRKYRPTTFESIVGQENVTRILKNQIKNQKISHAYMFSGSRGTGKTSAAKIFARAINCLNPHEGEPCNECEVCKNILEGNTTDVIEMDAASNNSVDNIRQIRQEVVYATIGVKYRVYIIDEVHMLTTSAFNALLKTLEEPPANVVFILATTEQHKIPVTILSRCLRFDFGKIQETAIVKRLKFVLEEEQLAYEEEAISYIAKLAEGALRDALSILERCISEYEEKLTYQDVLRIVGAIDKEVITSLSNAILNQDTDECLLLIDGIIEQGKDLRQLNYQLTEKFLDLLIAEMKEKEKYIKIIDKLSKLDNDLRLTTKPMIVYKSNIIELCLTSDSHALTSASSVPNLDALFQKMDNMQQELQRLKKKTEMTATVAAPSVIPTAAKRIPTMAVAKAQDISREDEENLVEFTDMEILMKHIIEQGKLKLYSSLASTKIYLGDQLLVVITNNSFAYSILALEENTSFLKDTYDKIYGGDIRIAIRLKEETQDTIPKIEKVFKENEINYTPID